MPQIENPPRKPFVARGSGVVRCKSCYLPEEVCICAYRQCLPANCQFWLLTHRYEVYKPTNTGRLIEDCVQGTRIFEWSRTEPSQELLDALADPAYAPMIVFPAADDYQERMVSANPQPDRIPVFIILDGTWRQARRMFRHGRYLQDLPVIQPDTERLSQYKLRRSTQAEHLCTAEVAIALLEQFGEQACATNLESFFDRFNRNYLATRRRWAKQEIEEYFGSPAQE